MAIVTDMPAQKGKRLVAAGVRFGHRHQGAVEGIEAIVLELLEDADVFIARSTSAIDHQELGDDAPHWLGASVEAVIALRDQLRNLMCLRHDDKLATWLVPGSLHLKYCPECAETFRCCEQCGAWTSAPMCSCDAMAPGVEQ